MLQLTIAGDGGSVGDVEDMVNVRLVHGVVKSMLFGVVDVVFNGSQSSFCRGGPAYMTMGIIIRNETTHDMNDTICTIQSIHY